MEHLRLHRWRVTPREAARIQLRIRERVELTDRLPRIHTVAGADLAYDAKRNRAIAGVVVYRYPEMEEIERVWAEVPITFPYVPGLLSFREMPALLKKRASPPSRGSSWTSESPRCSSTIPLAASRSGRRVLWT